MTRTFIGVILTQFPSSNRHAEATSIRRYAARWLPYAAPIRAAPNTIRE
jgi:hypothetical protein